MMSGGLIRSPGRALYRAHTKRRGDCPALGADIAELSPVVAVLVQPARVVAAHGKQYGSWIFRIPVCATQRVPPVELAIGFRGRVTDDDARHDEDVRGVLRNEVDQGVEALQHLAQGNLADLTWQAPADLTAKNAQLSLAAISAHQAWSANHQALGLLQAGLTRFSSSKPQRWVIASFEHHNSPHGVTHPPHPQHRHPRPDHRTTLKSRLQLLPAMET
jgi:hypothetical protein